MARDLSLPWGPVYPPASDPYIPSGSRDTRDEYLWPNDGWPEDVEVSHGRNGSVVLRVRT